MTDQADSNPRARRIELANMRQELFAPAVAIVGYGEILREAAERGSLDDMLPDLERILRSARELQAMVDRLLDTEAAKTLFDGADHAPLQKMLRHDLRTPLNAIIGYGEMLLEDLDDLGGATLRADLETLLTEAGRLVTMIDTIVDFSRSGTDAPVSGADAGTGAVTDMFAEIIRSMGPVSDVKAKQSETGRILVVDDIESNRDLLSRRLKAEGHSVVVAEGGRQALALLETEDVDLVLLDLMMPDLNGLEVLTRMKADTHLHDVPVIMISALDEMDSMIRCIEMGAEDYLPKPFNPVLLKARISACLEKKHWHDRERLYLDRLEEEKERYERLLLNILPQQIVERLNEGETIIADRFEAATVLFGDLVKFTELSSQMQPGPLVQHLNRLFSEFDVLADELGVEKIKMIGDCYMVAAGVPVPSANHAQTVAQMGLGMLEILDRVNRAFDRPWMIRIGINSGPVIAGIIGTHRFVYDMWGDTVNLASRLESHGMANRIQISGATARLLADDFEIEPRGTIGIKGKGRLKTYFLNAARTQSATAGTI